MRANRVTVEVHYIHAFRSGVYWWCRYRISVKSMAQKNFLTSLVCVVCYSAVGFHFSYFLNFQCDGCINNTNLCLVSGWARTIEARKILFSYTGSSNWSVPNNCFSLFFDTLKSIFFRASIEMRVFEQAFTCHGILGLKCTYSLFRRLQITGVICVQFRFMCNCCE